MADTRKPPLSFRTGVLNCACLLGFPMTLMSPETAG